MNVQKSKQTMIRARCMEARHSHSQEAFCLLGENLQRLANAVIGSQTDPNAKITSASGGSGRSGDWWA